MDDVKLQEVILDILPQISFFGGITKSELSQLMEYIHETDISQGEYVYREGDPPGDLYILLDGEVDFFILDEKVAESKRGVLFGMSAAIGIQKQMVSALAKKDLELAVISKKLFHQMRKKNPELFGKITLNIARDLARDLKFLRDYVEQHKKSNK